ncbi:importin subunit alpha-3 [Helicoverpa zea]|uniref:IBB domain-containing protein n=1 Tax=Helicoverpa armigera TaxID=29058 RepID=A0A2W1BJP0_HELAM|nr:importin subunit alpha-3 [Helicoverpa zea]PZC73884.1 hypothetical protein B5X24_HaOG208679 [Helicoverpa armigera]
MDEEAIENIRETSRNTLVLNRRKHRDEVADVRRSMHSLRTNSDTITQIANKLKTKAPISLPELNTLKNALIDDPINVEVVLHTHGALRGLVREMTGHEANKQCAAVGCVCNLALGDARAGYAVAKAAGPYLIAALDNLTTEYAVTSAWTLGNLAGSGPKACDLLVSQGSIAKLTDLLISNNEDTREGVLYALVRFAHQLRDEFRMEYLHRILQTLPNLKMAASSQLLFILSCHRDFTNHFITEEFLLKILRYLGVSIEKSIENPNIVYLFRFLANLNCIEVFSIVLSNLLANNKVNVLKKLMETENVSDSVLWFLGNAYKCCSNHEFFAVLLR